MINDFKKYKLKRCFVRFEPEIEDGTVFIFNKEDGKMLEGDYYSYLVVKALQNQEDLEELARMISIKNGQTYSETIDSIAYIIRFLDSEGFIKSE